MANREVLTSKLDTLQMFLEEFQENSDENIQDLFHQVELVTLSCWSIGITCSKVPKPAHVVKDALSIPIINELDNVLQEIYVIASEVLKSDYASDAQVEDSFKIQRHVKRIVTNIIQALIKS